MLTDEEWKRVREWSGAERTARRNMLSILFNAMKEGCAMESFEDIRKTHIKNMSDELILLAKEALRLGVSGEEIMALITEELYKPTSMTSVSPDVGKEG